MQLNNVNYKTIFSINITHISLYKEELICTIWNFWTIVFGLCYSNSYKGECCKTLILLLINTSCLFFMTSTVSCAWRLSELYVSSIKLILEKVCPIFRAYFCNVLHICKFVVLKISNMYYCQLFDLIISPLSLKGLTKLK